LRWLFALAWFDNMDILALEHLREVVKGDPATLPMAGGALKILVTPIKIRNIRGKENPWTLRSQARFSKSPQGI